MAIRTPDAEPLREPDVTSRFMIAQSGPRPSAGQLAFQRDLADTFAKLAQLINCTATDSPEKSMALTKLEEGLMWTGKAIFQP